MKNLFEYIQEVDKEYNWRIKFAVPVTAEMLDKVEELLARFGVKKVGPVKKTIMQARPLDFADIGPCEIYITDVVCQLPATREAVRERIARGLGITNDVVIVRSPDEPLELEHEGKEPESEKKEEPLLTSDYPKTEEPTKFYGDVYNQDLVKKSKGPFKYEVAGKEPTAKDAGPVYGTKDKDSPMGNKAIFPKKKHLDKV